MRCLHLVLLISLLSSCAWNHQDFLKTVRGNKNKLEKDPIDEAAADVAILKDFEVEDSPSVVGVSEMVLTTKPETQKIIRSKTHPPLKRPLMVAERPIEVKPLKEQKKSRYPKKFPEDLKDVDKQAQKVWQQFNPRFNKSSSIYLNIDYMGMTVGKIATFYRGIKKVNNQQVHHFEARFKSAPFYSNIYELDNVIDTYVSVDEFLSVRYNLVQKESKQKVSDIQVYDREKMWTTAYYHQKKKKKDERKKVWENHIPYYSIDPLSVVFLFQGLPLNKGDAYTVPVVNKAKVLLVKTVVEDIEEIEVSGKKYEAIRVHAVTSYTGSHLKSGDIVLWFSNDEKRDILKVKAKIKIGSVYAELASEE